MPRLTIRTVKGTKIGDSLIKLEENSNLVSVLPDFQWDIGEKGYWTLKPKGRNYLIIRFLPENSARQSFSAENFTANK